MQIQTKINCIKYFFKKEEFKELDHRRKNVFVRAVNQMVERFIVFALPKNFSRYPLILIKSKCLLAKFWVGTTRISLFSFIPN